MEKPLNILVTGSNGQLGRSIRKEAEGSKDNYIFTEVQELDITDPQAVKSFVNDNKIDVIVNCAAYTNVDAAEDHEDIAMKINGDAPGILARAIKERDGSLVHVSTDYVFGGSGKNEPLKEDQSPSPTGAYGRTKLRGEEEIEKSGASAVTLRTAWLYSDYGNNFVEKILSLLQNRDSIKVVFDQCGTPTYATDLAKAIVDMISERKIKGNEGIYHFSNEGVCSWYDFAHAAANIAGLKGKEVLPCHSSEFPSKVIRPPYSVLDKTKYKETFGKKIPHWHDSLYQCLNSKL
ncbi:MAG: dTDP-4-dehydrorhamnose reductase [Muribaculaceae bacterium]|nr:dTDP-4-dehydrorhamnose reductase [Muribaculaceae bacterium]